MFFRFWLTMAGVVKTARKVLACSDIPHRAITPLCANVGGVDRDCADCIASVIAPPLWVLANAQLATRLKSRARQLHHVMRK